MTVLTIVEIVPNCPVSTFNCAMKFATISIAGASATTNAFFTPVVTAPNLVIASLAISSCATSMRDMVRPSLSASAAAALRPSLWPSNMLSRATPSLSNSFIAKRVRSPEPLTSPNASATAIIC